jgi:hypothetical protein
MLRDNLAELIEPMLSGAGANPLALRTAAKKPSDDRLPCLENPRPEGAELTLTENAPSPFHAEPKQKCLRSIEQVDSSVPICSKLVLGKSARKYADYFETCRRKRNTIDCTFSNVATSTSSLSRPIPETGGCPSFQRVALAAISRSTWAKTRTEIIRS